MTALAEGFVLIIAAATLFGFIARKTKQPLVVAYIVTGMVLGPVGFSLIGETELTQILSELGLVFLLFLIGLEIKIKDVREVLKPTAVIGIGQMSLTFILGFGTGVILGFSSIESVFIGAAAMFSSTALVVKMLSDRDETTSLPGRLDIGVLLVQDVAVILLLALLTTNASNPAAIGLRLVEIFGIIGLIGLISLLSSRYFLPKLFKQISGNKHAFFVHGVAWAFIFITAAGELNLSMEIGAFFAGLSLAQLPYSQELQERVRPLTDLFMAIFFINFGLGMSAGQLTGYLPEALMASAVIMSGKFLIFFGLIDRLKFTPQTSFTASLNMTQISEFSLILAALAFSKGFIGSGLVGFLSIVAVVTMGCSSYLITFSSKLEEFAKPVLDRLDSENKTDLEVSGIENHVIVVGYDAVTKHLLPVMKEYFETVVVVDNNPGDIDELARSEYEFIYGDFRHSDIRKSAGLDKADLVVSVAPDFEVNKEIVEHVDHEPTVFLKADTMEQAGELYEMGAHYVIIRNILTGEKMSEYVRLFLEDSELFMEEIQPDIDKIMYGGDTDF